MNEDERKLFETYSDKDLDVSRAQTHPIPNLGSPDRQSSGHRVASNISLSQSRASRVHKSAMGTNHQNATGPFGLNSFHHSNKSPNSDRQVYRYQMQ